ncbi:MAG: hypothetical protein ABSA84_03315 [Gammaproteobacteria bacterium]|jgi:hypothetical protein
MPLIEDETQILEMVLIPFNLNALRDNIFAEITGNYIVNNNRFNILDVIMAEEMLDLNRVLIQFYLENNNININNDAIINIINNGAPGAWLAEEDVIHNQTVHAPETERTIYDAVEKLHARYSSSEEFNFLTDLQSVISFLQTKVNELKRTGKLNNDDDRVIQANFLNLLNLNLLSLDLQQIMELQNKAYSFLKLAIVALQDKKAAEQMIGYPPLVSDMEDRWAGWFKSAIIDSQLAYRRDRGDMSYPSEEELNRDKSCFGGNLNRIIAALNLIHPDVEIQEGQSALANMEKYFRDRNIAKVKEFGQNELQEVADSYVAAISLENLIRLFSELEKLEKKEQEQKSEDLILFEETLKQHIITEAKKSIGEEITPYISELTPFIDTYIDNNFFDKIKELIYQQEIGTEPSEQTHLKSPQRRLLP